jgi:hypothetical protein
MSRSNGFVSVYLFTYIYIYLFSFMQYKCTELKCFQLFVVGK